MKVEYVCSKNTVDIYEQFKQIFCDLFMMKKFLNRKWRNINFQQKENWLPDNMLEI